MATVGKKITDHVFKKYKEFIEDTMGELHKDGHLSKKQVKDLMADGRVILSLPDRFMVITATSYTKKKEQEVKFEFIVRKK